VDAEYLKVEYIIGRFHD